MQIATIIWWSGCALTLTILFRALAGRRLSRYPVFYSYLAFVLVDSLLKYYVFVAHRSMYPRLFWYSEHIAVFIGFGIIWEVQLQVRAQSPGVARLTRILVCAAVVLILSKGVANTFKGYPWGDVWDTGELVRNLRTVQAVVLTLMIALLAYYSVPVGRHIRGILVGYGLFVGASVINLALRADFGPSIQPWVRLLQQLCYVAALSIWCSALWSDQPDLVSGSVNVDYSRLSTYTLRALSRARRHLLRANGA